MKTMDLGKVAISPKGEYDAGTQYHALDIISHEGSSYLVLKDALGITPAEGEYYQLMAKKGNDGAKGDPGDRGLTGPAGKDGIGKKRAARFVIATSWRSGWTEDDCDYLCDGTDDQVEINQAIDALGSLDGEILFLDGEYHISAPVSASFSHNIMLRGSGTVIFQREFEASSESDAVICIDGDRSRISNIQIDGNISSYSDAKNFGIYVGGYDSTIDNIAITGSPSGIYIDAPRCIIQNSRIDTHRGYGIYGTYSCSQSHIAGCNISVNGTSIYADRDIRVTGCYINGNSNKIILTENVTDDTIFTGNYMHGDMEISGKNILISGNWLHDLYIHTPDGVTTSGIQVCSNFVQITSSLLVMTGDNILVSGNLFYDTTYYGNDAITLYGSNNAITNNIFGCRGIMLDSGSNCIVSGNIWYYQSGTSTSPGVATGYTCEIGADSSIVVGNTFYMTHNISAIYMHADDAIIANNMMKSVYGGIDVAGSRNLIIGNHITLNTAEYQHGNTIKIYTTWKNTAVLYNIISTAITNSGTSTTNTGNIMVTV